jgi:hypothetical protein
MPRTPVARISVTFVITCHGSPNHVNGKSVSGDGDTNASNFCQNKGFLVDPASASFNGFRLSESDSREIPCRISSHPQSRSHVLDRVTGIASPYLGEQSDKFKFSRESRQTCNVGFRDIRRNAITSVNNKSAVARSTDEHIAHGDSTGFGLPRKAVFTSRV